MLVSRIPGELIECQTLDGLRLHGFLIHPSQAVVKNVWIVVHGVSGNFFSSSLLHELTQFLVAHGDAVLRINTRGRDSMATHTTPKFAKRGGATYESLSDSVDDLQGWYVAAKELGFTSIRMAGHSLGALKTLLFAKTALSSNASADLKDWELDRILAISPPRFCHAQLKSGARGSEYLETLQVAREQCAAGRYDHLMKVYFPFPMLISASTYLDKYGDDDRYDYLPWMSSMDSPTLICFGEEETHVRQGGEPKACFFDAENQIAESLRSSPSASASIRLATIKEADHNYAQNRSGLFERLESWLLDLQSADSNP